MSIIGANNTMLTNELILLPIQTDVDSTISANNQKLSGLQPDGFGGSFTGESIHHPYAESFSNSGINTSITFDFVELVTIDFNKFNNQQANLSEYNEVTLYTVVEILQGSSNNPVIENPIMTSANRIIYRKDPVFSHLFQQFNLFTEPVYDSAPINWASSSFIRLNNDQGTQVINGDIQYKNSSSILPIRAYFNFPSFDGYVVFRVSGLILYSGF